MGLLNGIVHKNHLLLSGVPKSGSTWLGKILSSTMDYSYVHQPDDEKISFFAYYAKQGLSRFPVLDENEDNKKIHELYQMAFFQPYITSDSYSNQYLNKLVKLDPEKVEECLLRYGRNPEKGLRLPFVLAHLFPKQLGNRNNRVVKTIFGVFITDFILQSFENIRPLFIIRHPAAIVSSLLQSNNNDIDRKLYLDEKIVNRYPYLNALELENQTLEFLGGLQLGLLYHEINRLMNKYPNARLIQYEEVLKDPFLYSYNLYKELNMKWNDNVELYIANAGRKKNAAETKAYLLSQATKWKKDLTATQIEQIKYGYQFIKGSDYYQDF